MKKNKGYTLFEFIVALAVLAIIMAEIAGIMGSSQRLYSHGVYEVQLQENAQQVVQVVQDLLADAAVEIPVPVNKQNDPLVTDTTSQDYILSQIITIKTKERLSDGTLQDVTYTLGRGDDLEVPGNVVHGDASAGTDYTTLYLTKTTGAGGGAAVDYIPIADNVRGIRLNISEYGTDLAPDTNITNYASADRLTLAVKMAGEKYTYSMTSEVFLRNRIGTKPSEESLTPVPSDAYANIEVLRYLSYDLTSYVPDGYDNFKWSDADSGNTDYSLSGSSVACSGLNSSWGAEKTATIYASDDPSDYSSALKITIHTSKVNNNQSLPLFVYDSATYDLVNVVPVTGIATSKCTGYEVEVELKMDEFTSIKYNGNTYNNIALIMFNNLTPPGWVVKWNGTQYKPFPKYDSFGPFETPTVIATFTGSEVNLSDWQVQLWLYKKKAGASSTAHSNDTELNDNYSKLNDGSYLTLIDNNMLPKYKIEYICKNHVNTFTFSTNTDVNDCENYWNYIVDPAVGNGYIRLKFIAKYPAGKEYTAYLYIFPQDTGDADQHAALWNSIAPTTP